MGKQKYFKREILERFMTEEELDKFETDYFKAKLINLGKTAIKKSPFVF
jgi:hypothetical protein